MRPTVGRILVGVGVAIAVGVVVTVTARSLDAAPTTGAAAVGPVGAPPGAADDDPAGAGRAPAPMGALRPLPPAAGLPATVEAVATPVGLRVPAIGIDDGPVVAVGVEADGELEVPSANEVGWYRFGSRPGEQGSTVLAAHIAYDGADGVFRSVSAAEPGTVVEVVLSDDRVLRYRIEAVVEYDKERLPTEELFAETGPDRLVLITCGGDFNPRLRSYDSNVVAYATRH